MFIVVYLLWIIKFIKQRLPTSVVCRINRKVSETRRSFKQTYFCDKGPGFSNEANPH